jgi:hypothetical protein
MKKILVFVVLTLSCHLMFASGPFKIKGGLIAIPTNSWLITDYVQEEGGIVADYTPEFTLSGTYGIATGVYFTELIGIELDLLYGSFDQTFTTKISNSKLKYTTSMTVIDIPVLFKFSPGLFYVEAGPQYTLINKVENSGDRSGDVSDQYINGNFSWVSGGGLGIGIPKILDVEAGLRFTYGVSDLNSSGNPPFSSKVHTFSVGLKLAAVHEF